MNCLDLALAERAVFPGCRGPFVLSVVAVVLLPLIDPRPTFLSPLLVLDGALARIPQMKHKSVGGGVRAHEMIRSGVRLCPQETIMKHVRLASLVPAFA